MKKIIVFILSVLIVQLAGALGAFLTMPSIGEWYAFLNKPSFNPPNWIFGPVWALLYFLMAAALFLVLKAQCDKKEKTTAILFFAQQLSLNVLWSGLFFTMRNPMSAFFELVILWISIFINIFVFYRISKTAGLILLPYILWVSFAGFLNFAIWQLNP